MVKLSHCPACNTLWHETPIPEQFHHNYSPPYFYSRVIALQTWEADRTHAYMCPDCKIVFNLDGTINNTNQ
jgi:hypothetical protein